MDNAESIRVRGDFTVTTDQADRRLDRVLRGLYSDVPLDAIMKAVRKGTVRVNGVKSGCAARLDAGDVVSVPWAPRARSTGAARGGVPLGSAEGLKTLLRTDDIWCLDKPAGLLSQPDKSGGDSLITRIWAALSWERDDFRPALIGRLDRNVSGVSIIALNAPVLRLLSSLVREGRVRKIYRAVVLGLPPESGEINLPIMKDERTNRVMAGQIGQKGQNALTKYRVLRRWRNFSMVELELVTGRPHQARIHMSSIGHPIAGDFKYGDRGGSRGRGRLFLHAHSISLPEDVPGDLGGVTILSPLPEEFGPGFGADSFGEKA
ncbi:MAG: RluA family pseudouridine synthase [Synergistaceae bacterium]|jgi:23S rRNA pseudouridine955/2504/2580 synthase|nr:RluA family pseudouridine synthase [Synergistaceae bacterium]